jgi:glycosyltransferase involved in cell wall biosynthesis
MFKLALASVIAFVLLFNYTFEIGFYHGSSNEAKKYNIGIVVQKVTLGDKEVAERYRIAAQNLGWNVYVLKYKAKIGRYYQLAWIMQRMNDLMNYFFKPDFLILIYPSYYPVLSAEVPKYLVFFGNASETMAEIAATKDRNNFFSDYQNLGNYQGFIDIGENSEWFNRYDLNQFATAHHKINRFVINGYPTTFRTNYQPLKYQHLFYCGGNWDSLRSSDKYKAMFQKLETYGDFNVYGPENSWLFLKNAYKGYIPNDGQSLIDKIREAGIALVLHSDYHNAHNLPSARIFEAAAAGAAIISDRNNFVVENFGTCVYFIDSTNKTAAELAEEITKIKRHIQANPKEAEERARCAHQVFVKRYSMEELLLRLADKFEQQGGPNIFSQNGKG